MKLGLPRVMVAGHLCLDITPVFPVGGARLDALLVPGKLTQMERLTVSAGGVVANTGVTLQRLGARVEFCGLVGDDTLGELAMSMMQKLGIKSGITAVPGGNTSYTVVLAPPGCDRIFLHAPGVNDHFGLANIDFERLSGVQHLHFGYPPLMASTWQDGGAFVAEMFKKAREMGATTSLDMAAVDPASPAGAVDWKGWLQKVLPHVDFFVPSAEELAYMLDRPLYSCWQKGGEAVDNIDMDADLPSLAGKVMGMGAGAVLIKCGHRGLYFAASQHLAVQSEIWAGQQMHMPCFVPRRVASGTGAGDASIGGFLYAALAGMPLADALELAAGMGAACVEEYDSLSGVQCYETVAERIRSGWPKQR